MSEKESSLSDFDTVYKYASASSSIVCASSAESNNRSIISRITWEVLFKRMLMLLLFVYPSVINADSFLRAIDSMVNKPEEQIDIARMKLLIDSKIREVDVDAYIKKIDDMVKEIRNLTPKGFEPNTSQIRQYLYTPGPWNNNEVYAYNLDDPFGSNLLSGSLANYIDTKRGNCVSMPTLYYILADRLGIKLYFSSAPRHLFLMCKDNDGIWAIAATSNGSFFPLREYVKEYPINNIAKNNNIYFMPLSRKEVVGYFLNDLVIYQILNEHYIYALRLSDFSLKLAPNHVLLMMNKASAFYNLSESEDYLKQFGQPTSKKRLDHIEHLIKLGKQFREEAKALGFEYMSEESRKRILDYINKERMKNV